MIQTFQIAIKFRLLQSNLIQRIFSVEKQIFKLGLLHAIRYIMFMIHIFTKQIMRTHLFQ